MAELLSLAKAALVASTILVLLTAIIFTYLAAGYWLGSPLGTLIVDAYSIAGISVDPTKAPVAARTLGALLSVIFWFCGIGVESARSWDPETSNLYSVYTRAAVIGFAMTVLLNGLAFVGRRLWSYALGGGRARRVKPT